MDTRQDLIRAAYQARVEDLINAEKPKELFDRICELASEEQFKAFVEWMKEFIFDYDLVEKEELDD